MSVVDPQATEAPTPAPSFLQHPLLRDAVTVLVWFAALGVVGALVWWQVTPLAEFTRTATNAEMGEEQLGRQVAADGWFVVIGGIGGLISGVVLLVWRRRDPVAMVVLVALGGLLAGWVMLEVGLWLGPQDPKHALAHVAVGAKVPMQLKPHASGVEFTWSIAALLGALGVIWGVDNRPEHPRDADAADRTDGGEDESDDPRRG
jgi:hypothetical protein